VNARVTLYRVDIVFVGNVSDLRAEARLKHAEFSEGKRYFTECGKSRGALRMRLPKLANGRPGYGWARSEYEAWQVAINNARIRRAQVIQDLELESARTEALLIACAWVDDPRREVRA
jgi:hypothetical protein